MSGKSAKIQKISGQEELFKAIKSFQNFIYAVYYQHSFYFKLVGLIVLIIIAYKLGKRSLQQPIEKKVKNLSKAMQKSKQLRTQLPQRRQKIKRYKKILIIVFALIVITLAISTYLQLTNYSKQLIIATFIVAFLSWGILFVSQRIYKRQFEQIFQNQIKITQSLDQLSKQLGDKVVSNLKNHLCRETLLKTERPKLNDCSKKKCQEDRLIANQRYKSIKYYIERVINFDWCSICKNRKPFDELLSFRNPVFRGQNQNPQIQVQNRLKFLKEGINQMIQWINQAGPCNCSSLYWEKSSFQAKAYKETEQRLVEISKNPQILKNKNMSESMIKRT